MSPNYLPLNTTIMKTIIIMTNMNVIIFPNYLPLNTTTIKTIIIINPSHKYELKSPHLTNKILGERGHNKE